MIFGTWMCYFISWQILEYKVQSPVRKKEDWAEGTFTFYFLSKIIHRKSSQYWIVNDVEDGVSCISNWHTGLVIVQCCNIVPSLVSPFENFWESVLYFAPQLPHFFDHFCRARNSPLPTVRDGVGCPSLPCTMHSIFYASLCTSLFLNWIEINEHMKVRERCC